MRVFRRSLSGCTLGGMRALLLSLSLLLLVTGGCKKFFGAKQKTNRFGKGEVRYVPDEVSDDEAQSVGSALFRLGYLDDKGAKTVVLTKVDDLIQLGFVVKEGFWDDQGAEGDFSAMGHLTATILGHKAVRVALLDKHMEEKNNLGEKASRGEWVQLAENAWITQGPGASKEEALAIGKKLMAMKALGERQIYRLKKLDGTLVLEQMARPGSWG